MPTSPQPATQEAQRKQWASRARSTQYAQTASINFIFDNAAVPLTAGARLQCRVGFSGRLVMAQILADVAGAVTFDLFQGTYEDYPANLASVNKLGARPALTALTPYKVTLDSSGWIKFIHINDVMVCTLSVVDGLVTSVTLSLIYKKMVAPGFGTESVIDGSSNSLVDDSGNPVELQL